ncbi:MAG: UbiA family prenyltransferase [Halovenus sp.]
MASEPKRLTETAEQTARPHESYLGWAVAQGRSAWRVAEYSAVYLALLAVAEVLIVQSVLSLPVSPAPVVVGLITFAIYANDRIIDLESDWTSSPRRSAFIHRHKGLLSVFAALSYGVAVALSVLGGPVAFGLTILPGVAWVTYAINWLPGISTSVDRLKEVIVLNSLVVAGAWSLAVVLLPLAYADSSLTPAVGVILLYYVLAVFVDTEIANVGDIESDRNIGVSTVPTALGLEGTRRCLYVITVFLAVVLAVAAFAGLLTVKAAAVLSLGVATLLLVTSLLGRVERHDRLTVAAECSRLPVLVALAVPFVAW